MSGASARRDPALAAALAAAEGGGGEPLPPASVLAAHLLAEMARGPASFWAPYLAFLPRAYTTLGCFAEADAAALQAGYAVDAATAAAERVRSAWRQARPLLEALGASRIFCVAAHRAGTQPPSQPHAVAAVRRGLRWGA